MRWNLIRRMNCDLKSETSHERELLPEGDSRREVARTVPPGKVESIVGEQLSVV